MTDYRNVIIGAYRRIAKAAEEGRGVRLSAKEVDYIMEFDGGIRHAVEASYCEGCACDVKGGLGTNGGAVLCDECRRSKEDK